MIAGLLDLVLTPSALLETFPLFSISVSSSKFWTPTCDRAIRTGINHQEEGPRIKWWCSESRLDNVTRRGCRNRFL